MFLCCFPGSQGLFCPASLSDKEVLLLSVVDVLCHYCAYNSPTTNNNNNNNPGPSLGGILNPQTVAKKLVDLLDPDDQNWDAKKAFDLQLVRRVSCGTGEFLSVVSQGRLQVLYSRKVLSQHETSTFANLLYTSACSSLDSLSCLYYCKSRNKNILQLLCMLNIM